MDTSNLSASSGPVGQLAEYVDAPADARRVVSDTERRQLLEWAMNRSGLPPRQCVHEMFQKQAEQTPDAIAVTCQQSSLSYAALDAKANQLAHYLRSRGVGPDTLVGICVDRSLDMVVGLLGILKAGGAYVPVDPGYPADRIAEIIADSAMPLILTQHATRLPSGTSTLIIRLDTDWDQLIAPHPALPVTSDVCVDNLVYVIYTSGSTGRPKGILFKHAGLANAIDWMRNEYRVNPTDRALQKSPCTFGVSAWEVFLPLSAGAKVVVAKPEGHRDIPYLKRIIEQERITILNFVPSMLQLFMDDAAEHDLTSLRVVLCAGEVLKTSLIAQFLNTFKQCELHNLYGQTETEAVAGCRCEATHLDGIAHIGRPRARAELYVLDESSQLVPIGVAGRLYIGGPGLGRGYLNLPEMTADRFVRNPFSANADDKLYKTGDLVRWLPDGGLAYVGRIDHQVKLHGLRVELGEIEAVLASHADVQLCAIMLREDINGNKRLVAYIVPVRKAAERGQLTMANDNWQDSGVDVPMLTRHMDPKWDGFLLAKLPEAMVPKTYVFMASFPFTSSGKINRQALPPPSTRRPSLQHPLELPSTPSQQRIASVWRDLLQLDVIGIDDSFFELGGHSLLVLQAQIQLSKIFQREISIVTLLQSPTVRMLAERIDCVNFGDAAMEAEAVSGSLRRVRAIALRKRTPTKTRAD